MLPVFSGFDDCVICFSYTLMNLNGFNKCCVVSMVRSMKNHSLVGCCLVPKYGSESRSKVIESKNKLLEVSQPTTSVPSHKVGI